jgi:hypothetical protein
MPLVGSRPKASQLVAANGAGAGHCSSTCVRCRTVSRIRFGAVLGPFLDLVEVAVVRDERIGGFLGGLAFVPPIRDVGPERGDRRPPRCYRGE